MATPTLRAVAPVTPEANLPFAPEPVVIYGLPSGGGAVEAADITDATSVGRDVLTATDAAAARTAIGAGTSNLAIGTTATTAKAGNAVQTATQTTATAIAPGTATNVQGILAELAARLTAAEAAIAAL